MNKTKEDLIIELKELQRELAFLKSTIKNDSLNKKLLESEEHYRYLFESNSQPMWIYDIETLSFLEINNAAIYHYGYSREEFLSMTIKDIRPKEDIEALLNNIKKTDNPYSESGDWRHLKKNGEIIFVQIISHAITINNRKARHVMINDITSQKKAIEDKTDALMLYNALVDQASDAFFVHDFEGKFIEVNQQACDSLGYSKEELLKLSVTDIEIDLDLNIAKKEWEKIELGNKFTLFGHHKRKDGTVFPVEVRFGCSQWKGKKLFLGLARDVTERNKAEESLRQSEENLAITLNSIGDGVIATDLNGLVVKMNPIAEKLCGWTLTEAEGKQLTEVFNIVNANSKETLINPVKKVLENGEIVGLANSTVLISKNGIAYQISDSAAPIKNKEGNISGVVLVFSDVTEKYLTEQSLIENEERLNLFFNQSLTGFFFMINDEPVVWDETVDKEKILYDVFGSQRVTKVNKAMLDQYLATEDEFINRTLNEFFAHDLEQGRRVIKDLFDRGSLHIETSELRFDGTQIWIEGDYICLYDSSGRIKGLFGTQHDITNRKNEQDQLRKLSRAVEQSPASIVLTDTQGNIEYVNPKTLKVTGYEFTELIGKNPKIFSAGEKPKEEYKILWHNITSGKEWQGEFHNKKKNGELYWEQASISSILNKAGEITHFLAVKEDITERKQILEDLIIEKEHAEQSDKLKSAFLANMSHEIRTPMNGILGFTELLKQPDLSNEKQQRYINVIQNSGLRLLNIINDIVDISKIEAGVMKADIKPTNIREQIEYIYNFFKPEAEKKGLQFLVKNTFLEKDLIVETDSEKIYAIFTNLMKNAIKFTNKGLIILGYEKKGEYLEFYVKDTGIGIPQNKHKAIFERFIQADISNELAIQGAGLGLSITKAYVELLGGKIWLNSEVENLAIGKPGGTTFYFTIPFKSGPIIDMNTQNIELSDKTGEKLGKLKILIAEDDEASSLFLSILVEEFSSEILMAKNGIEAVEIFKNNPNLDLILMDMQMPYLNGYEATIQIRQLNKNVIIIAQTAYALSYDRQKVIEAGCNDYISKPISSDELATLIRKYFNNL